MTPLFFPTPADFRRWLKKHHASGLTEQWVGFWKKDSGQPSITWPESVDEALCFGWIDGLRKTLDDERYVIRFTPRKAGSHWSNVNVARVQALTKEGRMQPAGLAAFERRSASRTGQASYERKEDAKLSAAEEKTLGKHPKAKAFIDALPPGKRKVSIHWVVSAKKPETRERRLAHLIESAEQGLLIKSQRY